jgi:uncharacterized damage-inducible protein DinB
MKEAERIADQLKRAFYGKAWSGPSVKEALEGVTPGIAATTPIEGTHSIWELVHHITAWVNIARRRAEGETVVVTQSVNFPPVEAVSEAAWNNSLKSMRKAESALRKTILQIRPAQLERPTLHGGHSVYALLHGAIQHSLYHAGQIILLKKAHGGQSRS